MKLYSLPHKRNLVHLDAQFFVNEPGPGVSQYVIKIQYRCKRQEERTSFIIPVSTNTKEINRKLRRKMDADEAQSFADAFKTLKKEKVKFMFGLRQVTTTEKTTWGSRHFHRIQDANTYCWVKLKEDGSMVVTINWNDEPLTVTIKQHKHHEHQNANAGIGYWNPTEELEDDLKLKYDGTQTQEYDGDTRQGARGSYSGEDTRGEVAPCREAEPTEGAGCRDAREACGEKSSADTEGGRLQRLDELAAAYRKPKADSLGGEHQVPTAGNEHAEQEDRRPVARAAVTKPSEGITELAVKGSKRPDMDQPVWGVWEPERVRETSIGLGRTFSFPTDV